MDALVPRVTELGVTRTSAVSEPGTAATTTTAFPGFPDAATLAAYDPGARRGRNCGYLQVSIGQRNKVKTLCLVT